MQTIIDEIDHVLLVSFLFNLTQHPPEGDAALASLRVNSTMRWMSLRGSSYAGHGEDLAQELYGSEDAWLLRSFDFTVGDVIKVGNAVTKLHAERRNGLGEAGAEAANAHTMDWASMTEADRNRAMARAMMAAVGVREDGIRETATVTAALISQRDSSITVERAEAVLRELSVPVGSIDPGSYRGPFDKNPLRDRPFLEYDGEYVLALPGALTRDVDGLLQSRLLAHNPGFSKRRARSLDRLALEYLGRLLPRATTYSNLYYADAELDGLVLFERTALVVEGKGSGISAQGQRGDLARLRRDVEGAVEDAWRQAARVRDYLLAEGDSTFRDERGVEVLRIPSRRVREVIIVNPTLHELAGFAQQLPRLKHLGLFATGEYPWSVFINDLRVIAETCENAAVFLHYLVWRNRLPLGDRLAVTDEIDLWASYLLCERFTGLNDGGRMIIGNASTDFDAYYDGLAGRGPRRPAPTKFLPESIRTFVSRLAETRPPGWREAAGVCLDLSIPELAFVDATFAGLANEAAASGPVSQLAGRVFVLGVPRSMNPSEALVFANGGGGDPTFGLASRMAATGKAEIAWAQYRKPYTLELSDFEKQAFAHAAKRFEATPSAICRRPSQSTARCALRA